MARRRHKYIGSIERVALDQLEQDAKKQALTEQECVSCGRYKTGENPCRCSRPDRSISAKVTDAEFMRLLALKPEFCTCDWPVFPWHRYDCGVYKPVRTNRKQADEHPVYTDAVIAEEILEVVKGQPAGKIHAFAVATDERAKKLRAFLAANR